MSMLDRAVRAVRENYADDHGEEDYQRIAVAVLQAIREPTPLTTNAGKDAASFYVATYEEGLTPVQPVSGIVFTAMIDAILQGGE